MTRALTATPAFSVSPELLAQVSDKIAAELGLFFPEAKWDDLKRCLQAARKEFDCRSDEELAHFLLSPNLTKNRIEILASCIAIGETYFFRDPQVYEALETVIIPEIISRKEPGNRSLRIWSAACSTGEEPYSLAITLGKIPALKDWEIFLLATDINPISLEKAQAGFFSEWSFRGGSEKAKKRYFRTEKNGGYELLPEIRDKVSFANLNLAESSYPSPITRTTSFDIIFCRNVLMYFNGNMQEKVVSRMYQCLQEDGRLFVSAIEASNTLFTRFRTLNYSFGVVYQKSSLHKPKNVFIPNLMPFPSIREPLHVDRVLLSLPPAAAEPPIVDYPVPEEPRISKPVINFHAILETCEDLYNKGLFDQTVTAIESVLADQIELPIDPGILQPLVFMLIQAFSNQNRNSEALEVCERYLARDKLNQQWYLLKAMLLQEIDRIPQAIETLKQALYLDPKNSLFLYNLAGLYRKQNLKKESEKHYEQARKALQAAPPETVMDQGEHLTAGRLLQMIEVSLARLKQA